MGYKKSAIMGSAAVCALIIAGIMTSALPNIAIAQAAGTASAVIQSIEVKGNQRVETETILAYVAIAPGQYFDPEKIDISLKSLFGTGFFADVKFAQSGNSLIINVTENPTVNQVILEGQKALTTEKLEKEVQIKPRAWFTIGRIQADKKRLIEVYRNAGYFAAEINPKIVEKPQNRVDVIFEINEGPKTGVGAINIIGNNQYNDEQIKSLMATQESIWWKFLSSRDNYDPNKLEYDREQISKFYLNNGFYDFQITSATAELSPNQKNFLITFALDEGKKYKFGEVKINAKAERLNADALKGIVPIKSGSVYSRDQIEKAIETITFAAGSAGYAFVDVRPRENANPDDLTVDVVFDVDEGPRVYIDRIEIVGNTATLDHVIRRELKVAEGDAFNRVLLDSSKNRIKALGFFKEVEIEEKKTSLPDRTVLEVSVEEQPTGELAFSLGYSSQYAYQFDISVTQRNLRGRGQFFRFNVSNSAYQKNVDIRFTEPRFMGRNLAAGIDIFSVETDYLKYSSFLSQTTGFGLRAGFPLAADKNLGLNYTFRKDKVQIPGLDCTGNNATSVMCFSAGNYTTSLFGYNFNWDRRNSPIKPTAGFYITAGQSIAGIGTGVKYIRNELDAAIYKGLFPGWVLSGKLSLGYIDSYGNDTVRIRDRFFKGGQEFRGFKIAGLGPRIIQAVRAVDSTKPSGYADEVRYDYLQALGGKIFGVGTIELSVPTPLPESYKISSALFLDVGTLGKIDDKEQYIYDVGPGVYQTVRDGLALRASAGLSVFWESPFGPVRFDFSYPIAKTEYDRTETFRFSTSTNF